MRPPTFSPLLPPETDGDLRRTNDHFASRSRSGDDGPPVIFSDLSTAQWAYVLAVLVAIGGNFLLFALGWGV